jgi:NAD(P)-dependent dehydrogenase (short-subunit alcohol dehydrogenase family)
MSMSSLAQSLSRKVAVVTGGSRGIGLSIADALLARGASVLITGRDESHLDAARKDLSQHGSDRIHAVRADVRPNASAGWTSS